MKKSVFLLFILGILCACEGPQGPAGRDGVSPDWEIVNFTVEEEDWEYVDDPDGTNPHYVFDFDFDELTKTVYEKGNIDIYMYANPANRQAGYYPVTDSFPIERSNDLWSWTEFYSALCYPGGITFTARCSDFDMVESGEWAPARQTFRVVLNW
ncbi:MAG: hypothetical protein LUG98_00290 [Tannerellaceae bacterium]|nr:hypothetical protein [Tannerellaceae bacterium]